MPEALVRIGPSLLAADFAHLAAEIQRVEQAGADFLHLDIMDGRFVPNLSFGIPVVEAVRRATRLHLDTHLMLADPGPFLAPFAEAGADSLTVHVEVEAGPGAHLQQIHAMGLKAGLAVNPATPVDWLYPFLAELDLVLVMSVQPGFGGQVFKPEALDKVRRLHDRIAAQALALPIQIDGGIAPDNAALCRQAGVRSIVAGSFVFRAPDPAAAIRLLRG